MTKWKNDIITRIRPPPPPPPPPEPKEEPPRMKHRLADTARLVIRTKKLMDNLQQIRAAAAARKEQEQEDSVSMQSYGSHTHYPTGKKKKIKSVVVDEDTHRKENYDGGSDEDEKGDTNNYEGEDDDDDDDDTVDDENVPIHHIHRSSKQEEEEEQYPADCFPPEFYDRFPIFSLEDSPFLPLWSQIRLQTFKLIENKYFETAVIIMILLSSLALVKSKRNMRFIIIFYMKLERLIQNLIYLGIRRRLSSWKSYSY